MPAGRPLGEEALCMKIDNRFHILPSAASGAASRSGQAAPRPFEAMLTERCQETAAGHSEAARAVGLADTVLDLLERISVQLASGASEREMALTHQELARQAERLRQSSEALEPGPLKNLLSETAAVSYVQLWRFEQGALL